MEMPIVVVEPDPQIDAVRDSVAIERGPLVYAIEAADLAEPWHIEEISVEEPVTPEAAARDDVEPGLVGIRVRGVALAAPSAAWPYTPGCRGLTRAPLFGRSNGCHGRGDPLLRLGQSTARRDARLDPASEVGREGGRRGPSRPRPAVPLEFSWCGP